MNKDCELINDIYRNAEMAKYTLDILLCQLKNKDNNIKSTTKKILTEYDRYIKKIKSMASERLYKLEKQSFIAKMCAKMGIKKEVCCDNSDANISKMIIQGITLSILETEKGLSDNINPKVTQVANDFIKFQKDSIEELKQYL
jgi:uncharacterized protein (DUF305 family)